MISRIGGSYATHNRAAFTLPELLVVVTVTLVLMGILVQASTIITNTVSEAKAQGDFVGQERAALAVIRRDLQYDHFLEEDGKPNLGRKLSNQRTDQLSWYNAAPPMQPENWRIDTSRYTLAKGGYFLASAPAVDGTWNFDEGTDTGGFSSSRSGNHSLQFTIIVPGGSPDNTLTADVPAGDTTTSTCAEIAYFLVDNPTTTGPTKKYKLVRRQRIAARNGDDKPAFSKRVSDAYTSDPSKDPAEVVAARKTGSTFDVFNLSDLTLAQFRLGGADGGAARSAIATTSYRAGEDVLHNYVVSFELKFTGSSADGSWPRPFGSNTDYPYDTLPYNGQYDTFSAREADWNNARNLAGSPTGSNASPLKRIRITGVQIRLRCWNPSNRSARQTTTAIDL